MTTAQAVGAVSREAAEWYAIESMELLILGAFLVGMVLGRVQAQAALEKDFKDLQKQVREALESLDELERAAGPHIEARILERLYRQ